MAECILRDGTVLSDYGRPYIVSEVNSSHNGSMEVAKQMIDVSADMGCDCVKFQSWSADSLYSKTYYDANPIARRFVKKFSLSSEQLGELSKYCAAKGVSFSSTPYSEEEVDFLVEECNAPYIKIASMELNNPVFLNYIGRKGVPVILSTGMSTIEEISNAVNVLHDAGVNQMAILHCVSLYPTELTGINLNNILGFRKRFPMHPIGFSDHTEGDAAAIAAVAMGASVIEKHLTLDRKKVGMDNGMAAEPELFLELVRKCRDVQVAMGVTDRVLSQQEIEQRNNMRRSVVATRNMAIGEIIKETDLCAKRPGTGIAPNKMAEVVGKRVIKEIESDTLILPDSIE